MRNKEIKTKSSNQTIVDSMTILSTIIILSMISMIFLISFSAVQVRATGCSSISDCPISQCTGSIVICESNECKYSACILETGSINKVVDEDDYLRYSDDIVDNINISKLDIKTEQGFYESVLEWATFNKMILFSLGIFGSIFIIIILVLLWEMIKTNPVLLIFALTLLLILTALVSIVFIANPDIFDRISKGDFSFFTDNNVDELAKLEQDRQDSIITEKSFSKEFYKALDTNIDYAKELKVQSNDRMTSVIMLQFKDDNSALTYIDNKIKASNRTKSILGRLAYIYDLKGKNDIKTYRIISKNKVFLITGTDDDIESTMSRIFSDQSSGTRLEIEFDDTFCQNTQYVTFRIFDQSELIAINNFSIVVSGTGGFDFNDRICRKLSYGYSCNFSAGLNIGKNVITVNIVKYDGTDSEEKKATIVQKASSEIIYDPVPPQSRIDVLDKGTRIRFTLSDTGTGVDFSNSSLIFNGIPRDSSVCYSPAGELKTICSYAISPVQGQNNVSEIIVDKCRNMIDNSEIFVYDTVPPKITVTGKKPKVIEIYDQSGIKSIAVDGKQFDPNECMIMDDIYTCTISSGNMTSDIVVEDIFSNRVHKII